MSEDEAWRRLRQRYVDNWEPTEEDVEWLVKLVSKLKVGGKWFIPAAGVTFEKVAPDHLRLESIVTDRPIDAFIVIEKTRKVGERAGIRVDVEKAADYILFDLRKLSGGKAR
jgi:hypothetical protein